MTSGFIIKLRQFLDLLFQSFASQNSYIFSSPSIKKYGTIIKLNVEYYQPRRRKYRTGFIYLQQLLKVLSHRKMTRMIKKALNLAESFELQTRVSRLKTPALDSYILAQFFVYMTKHHQFSKIIQQIERKVVYKFFNNVTPIYAPQDPLHSKDRVLGLDVTLKGRIPLEPVRARKTIQNRTIGRRSERNINQHLIFINRAEGVNPRLGTFSV